MCLRRTAAFTRINLGLILLLAGIPSALAQQSPDVSALVADVSKDHQNNKVRSVAVFDFTGPDKFVSTFGRNLADQFSAALAKSKGGFSVVVRSSIRGAIESNRFAPDIVKDDDISRWLARSLGAEAAIVGRLMRDAENMLISLNYLRVQNV